MPEIVWGEGDVRDAMTEFDPEAGDLMFGGVRGERGEVLVFAYWGPNLRRQPHQVYCGGELAGEFNDPIEAIAHALSLVREGV